ncbi:tetratricopeptide repeat protein [Leptothrix ochracea]|uniref:tetratricopeptide repeat protein n=1 Tax=Leptothrix ochracea TaxID=735331 RepID=UPI0034E20C29
MPLRLQVRPWTFLLLAGSLTLLWPTAHAQTPSTPPVLAPAHSYSALDEYVFYRLLASEIELRRGEAGLAYPWALEAARHSRDESLFRHAVEIAINNRAGEQALHTARLWRQALPHSVHALETQAVVLVALGRSAEATEPLQTMLDITPAPQRSAAITGLTGILLRSQDQKAAAQWLEEVLKPWREAKPTRGVSLAVLARSWAMAGDVDRALRLADEAQQAEPELEPAAQLGLDLMDAEPRGEKLVTHYLDQPNTQTISIRIGYARRLTRQHRYLEALAQTETLTHTHPDMAPGWLLLGALQMEVNQPAKALASLQRFLALDEKKPPSSSTEAPHMPVDIEDDASEVDDEHPDRRERAQAYLMLAQAAEQTQDYAGAQTWLEKLSETDSDNNNVLIRRASLLQRQGQLQNALALIHTLPQSTPSELRLRIGSEAQILRDAQAWAQAYDVLSQGNQQLPDDADLLYEQAMLAERLQHLDEMEQLLRRVITLKPDHHHAYNALGYSLAERNERLEEARDLIAKALSLSPGDPYITDSLGWVEFRMGHYPQAVDLLQKAYNRRPDTEIAAHLGEALWVSGQQDHARQIWNDGLQRDNHNTVLQETLKRLQVKLQAHP